MAVNLFEAVTAYKLSSILITLRSVSRNNPKFMVFQPKSYKNCEKNLLVARWGSCINFLRFRDDMKAGIITWICPHLSCWHEYGRSVRCKPEFDQRCFLTAIWKKSNVFWMKVKM